MERPNEAESVSAQPRYFFFGRWLNALAAADFESLLVRPSRRTLEAFFATLALVTLLLAIVITPSVSCTRWWRRS